MTSPPRQPPRRSCDDHGYRADETRALDVHEAERVRLYDALRRRIGFVPPREMPDGSIEVPIGTFRGKLKIRHPVKTWKVKI